MAVKRGRGHLGLPKTETISVLYNFPLLDMIILHSPRILEAY
jgi:hypothetical protein